jgi:hypothetical protein
MKMGTCSGAAMDVARSLDNRSTFPLSGFLKFYAYVAQNGSNMAKLNRINRILRYIHAVRMAGLADGGPLSYVGLFAGEAAISRGLRIFGYEGPLASRPLVV